MKKLLTIIALALILCLGISAALAIDYNKGIFDSVDEFLDALSESATVKGVKICSSNLDEVIDKAEHGKYLAVTAEGKNDKDETEQVAVQVNVHSWVLVSYKAPTCNADGLATYKCYASTCDETKTEVLKKTENHVWVTNILTPATCTTEGKANQVCANCGTVKAQSEVKLPKLNAEGKHTFTDKYATVTAPTCDPATQEIKDGKKALKCDVCGFVDKDHPAKEGLTVKDYIALERENGNLSITDLYDGHDWDAWQPGTPTCAIGTNMERWCKNCAKVEKVELDATKRLDPVYTAVPAQNGMTLDCWYGQHDGKVNFVCALCNGAVHKKIENVAPEAIVEDGNVTGYKWINPEDSKWTVTVGHTLKETWRSTRKDSRACLDPIYADYRCTVCGEYLDFVIAEKPAAHTWSDWEVFKEGSDAETTVWTRYCTVCKNERVYDDEGNYLGVGVTQTKASATKPVDPCKDDEHKWVAEEIKEYKCGTTIDRKYTCSVCEATKTEKEELDHVYGEAIVAKAATCKEEGSKISVCKYCGNAKVEAIEKIAHTWDEGKVTKEATTEEAGEKTYTCTVCGATKTEEIEKLVADTEYTTTFDFDKDEMTLTGKATLKEGTEKPEAVYARVTYFYADGSYVVVSVPVEADGSYESMNSGNVIHVSVQIVNSAKVRPGEFTRFGGDEKDVK